MKKRYFARIVAVLTAGCLLIGGCGKSGGSTASSGDSEKNHKNDKKSESSVQLAPHYKTDETNLGTEGYMNGLYMGDEEAYFLTATYDEANQSSTYSFCCYIYATGELVKKAMPVKDNTSGYQNLTVGNDGKIYLMEVSYPENAEETGNWEPTYLLNTIDREGNTVSSLPIQLANVDGGFYCQNCVVLSDGRIAISEGNSGSIYVLDAMGNTLFTIPNQQYINSMVLTPDDRILVSYWGQEGSVISEVDLNTKAFGKTFQNCPNPNGNSSMVAGEDGTIYISTNDNLYLYNMAEEKSELLLSWLNCDIDGDTINQFRILPDGTIIAFNSDYSEEDVSNSMLKLTLIADADYKEKQVLTFACMYVDQDVKKHIIDFNRSNSDYRIEVMNYGQDSEDWEVSMERMNNDIIGGKAADIMDLSTLNVNTLVNKKVIEDLYPYFEKDNEIKLEDFQQSVLKAFEIDGKLYQIVPTFSIQTLVAKSSVVGKESGWTVDEMIQTVDSMGKDVMALQYGTKLSVLNSCMVADMGSYVNFETGECHFDSDEFKKLLEFSNRFPKEYEYNDEAPSTPALLKENKLLLVDMYVSDTEQLQMMEGMFGEPITMIGYPSKEGNGASISCNGASLAINSKSEYKDAAWEFIKYFMTDEYQESIRWNLPTKTKALDAFFEKAMVNDTYVDENGETQIQSKGTWGWDDFSMEMYAATEEQVAMIKDLIANTDHRYYNSEELNKIIEEETAAYFDGQKSADDVASIIQSRAQIFVNESR